MRPPIYFLLALLVLAQLVLPASVSAQNESAFDYAAEQTARDLKDKNQRKELINRSPEAKAAHQEAVKHLGQENLDETYAITADLLLVMKEQAGDDPKKLQELMDLAQKNPTEFYKRLPDSYKKRIKGLAEKMKQKHTKKTP